MPRKPTKSQTGASTRRNDENNAGPSRRKAVRKISSEEDSDDNQTRQSQRSKLAINGNKIGHFSPNNNENKAGPSRRKALRAISSSEESDDNQTRGLPQSSSSANTNHATIQNGDANATLVNNMVKYFLNFSATKIPIKKADIIKNVNVNFKIFPEIYKICIKILKKIYGLEVSEIEGKSAKVYIVYSSLCYGVSALQLPPDQRYEVSLLFIILSYIFMKGGEIQEGKQQLFSSQKIVDWSVFQLIYYCSWTISTLTLMNLIKSSVMSPN